jgi:hypothetical protein
MLHVQKAGQRNMNKRIEQEERPHLGLWSEAALTDAGVPYFTVSFVTGCQVFNKNVCLHLTET